MEDEDEYYDDEDEKSEDDTYTENTDKEPVYKTEPQLKKAATKDNSPTAKPSITSKTSS